MNESPVSTCENRSIADERGKDTGKAVESRYTLVVSEIAFDDNMTRWQEGSE